MTSQMHLNLPSGEIIVQTLAEWKEEMLQRFPTVADAAFLCPRCRNIATVGQVEAAGATEPLSASRECIGRYQPHRVNCSWTSDLGLSFSSRGRVLRLADGTDAFVFDFARDADYKLLAQLEHRRRTKAKPKPGPIAKPQRRRNSKIFWALLSGWSVQDLMKKYGISRTRVMGIVRQELERKFPDIYEEMDRRYRVRGMWRCLTQEQFATYRERILLASDLLGGPDEADQIQEERERFEFDQSIDPYRQLLHPLCYGIYDGVSRHYRAASLPWRAAKELHEIILKQTDAIELLLRPRPGEPVDIENPHYTENLREWMGTIA